MDFKDRYGPWTLVTGASAGIGQAICVELASMGLNIVAVARDEALLAALKMELEAKYLIQVLVIPLDLASGNFHEVIRQITEELDVGLIVPCAGGVYAGDFAKSSIETNRRMIELNVMHPVLLVQSFMNKLIARKHGGVLFVSSTFGYQAVPYVANYAATKAYVLAFGEALHVELAKFGIDVTTISPGLTATNMSHGLPIDFKKMPIFEMQPDQVAKFGIAKLGKGMSAIPGFVNNMFVFFNRTIPRAFPVYLFGFLVKRAFRKQRVNEFLISK